MKSYKLFVSFTSLYNLLDSGRVSFVDLRQKTSLFFLFLDREDILDPLPELTNIANLCHYSKCFSCYQWLTQIKIRESCYLLVPYKPKKLERNYSWCSEFQKILLQAEEENRVKFNVHPWEHDEEYLKKNAARNLLSRFNIWSPDFEFLTEEIWDNYHSLEKALSGKAQVLWR